MSASPRARLTSYNIKDLTLQCFIFSAVYERVSGVVRFTGASSLRFESSGWLQGFGGAMGPSTRVLWPSGGSAEGGGVREPQNAAEHRFSEFSIWE